MLRRISRGTVGVIAAAAVTTAGAAALAPQAEAAPAVWDRVAACESGGNWSINTGNGYYGGLQFSRQTWTGFGGGQYAATANQATKAQQIAIAQRVLASQGPGAWPVCSVRAGLTRANGGASSGASAGASTESNNNEQQSSQQRSSNQQRSSSSNQGSSNERSSSSSSSERSSSKKSSKRYKKYKKSHRTTSGKTITVRSGNTVSKLARKHGVEGGWRALAAANNLENPNLIFPGQKLVIPA